MEIHTYWNSMNRVPDVSHTVNQSGFSKTQKIGNNGNIGIRVTPVSIESGTSAIQI